MADCRARASSADSTPCAYSTLHRHARPWSMNSTFRLVLIAADNKGEITKEEFLSLKKELS